MSGPKIKKPSRRLKGGVLFVISLLMLASATLRMGVQAGPALTRELAGRSEETPQQAAHTGPGNPTKGELQQLLDMLQAREKSLNVRQIEIEDRAKALEIADAAVEQKIAALIQAEERLSATLALADSASEDDLARLTRVYEQMKPKEAAALFEEMDPEFAAGFLARMRPDAAAGLMAKLSPTAAYSISVILAGRNASVPKS